MGFTKPIEQYLFCNLLTKIHVFMYLKDIIRGENGMEETGMEDTGMKDTEYGRGTDPGSLMEENRRLEEENRSLKQVMLGQAGLYAELAAKMERTDMSVGLLMDLCRDSRKTAQTGYEDYEDRRDRTDER